MSGTTYNIITESQQTLSIPKPSIAYDCSQINVTSQYVVQPGDILVACVQGGGSRLGVAGTATTSILLGNSGCNTLDRTIDASAGAVFTLEPTLTLHLNLGKVLAFHKLCLH